MARRLLEPDFFSGWAIRALAARRQPYHPLSYHRGSAWPHDNAVIALGLARYGLTDELTTLTEGLIATAAHHAYRLPEVLAGYERAATPRPVPYRLRDDVAPPLERATGAEVLVGGATAASQDVSEVLADRLPLFVAVVVGLSSLLLLLVFRSVWIPVKAAVLNLLSISAALGVITLVFQHGWFGVQPGPVEAFIPALIFAIVFGLSMDYEVFLVSRIHEEWTRTEDHSRSVREGLAATGKVITAAAAIMIVVFAAFVLSSDRMLQQFGLGLAVAILLDAVVIRCLIVPAVLQMLGPRAWWLPEALARRLPELSVERPSTTGP